MDQEEVYIKDDGQLNFMGTGVTANSQTRKHEIMDEFVNGNRSETH